MSVSVREEVVRELAHLPGVGGVSVGPHPAAPDSGAGLASLAARTVASHAMVES